jgi:chitinase
LFSRYKYCAVFFLLLLTCAQWARATAAPDRYRIVGYVAGWGTPARIHAEKLTQINFAFAHIAPDGRVALADRENEKNLVRLVHLKRVNPRLKIIISIGGWQAEGFSDAALTDSARAVFADSAVELVRATGTIERWRHIFGTVPREPSFPTTTRNRSEPKPSTSKRIISAE